MSITNGLLRVAKHIFFLLLKSNAQFSSRERRKLKPTNDSTKWWKKNMMIFVSAPCSSTRFRHRRREKNNNISTFNYGHWVRRLTNELEEATAATSRGAPTTTTTKIMNKISKSEPPRWRWRCGCVESGGEREKEVKLGLKLLVTMPIINLF